MKNKGMIGTIFLFFILFSGLASADIVINEIMYDPSASDSDPDGEYIELYNTGDTAVDINGWILDDQGADTYLIANFTGPVLVPGKGYFVLCANRNQTENGNFSCDWEYDDFTLRNNGDTIILTTLEGDEADKVIYDGGPDFPDPTGASLELMNPLLDNSLGNHWRAATASFGDGDRGTPGQQNSIFRAWLNVTDIPDQTIAEGGAFATFDLDDYLTDADPANVSWNYSGNSDLLVVMDAENVVTITAPDENWYGAESITFTATDTTLATIADADTAIFTATPVDDAPQVAGLPDQTIAEGESFVTFDLDDYLTELDGEEVLWNYSGNTSLAVSIDAGQVVTITPPNEDWNGAETITFTATDNTAARLSSADSALFTITPVNDAPELTLLENNGNTTEGLTFALTFQVTDVDDTPSVQALVEPGVVEDLSSVRLTSEGDGTYRLNFVPTYNLVEHPNQSKTFDIILTADDGEVAVNETFTLRVDDANRAPVVQPLGTLEFTELMTSTYQVTATDPDGDPLTYSLTGEPAGMEISRTGMISWTPPMGRSDIRGVTVAVTDSPYAPRITTPGDIRIDAPGSTTEIEFNATVHRLLEISQVAVADALVAEGGDSPALKPGDEVTVAFIITNHYNQTVTGIQGTLQSTVSSPITNFSGQSYLTPDESQEYRATLLLPPWLTEASYPALIRIAGENELRRALADRFAFNFLIGQDPADVIITNLQLERETVRCPETTTLVVEYLNRGEVNEDDVVITLTNGEELQHSTEDDPLFNPAAQAGKMNSYRFLIPTGNLSQGSNTLTVELTYRGFYTTQQTIELTRESCAAAFRPTETDLLLADGERQQFSVQLNDGGADIRWYVGEKEVARGTDTYTFSQERPGTYIVSVLINGDETQTWTVRVTDVPLSDSLQVSADFTTFENAFGKIVYDAPIAFGSLVDLDRVISIGDGLAAVDTEAAPQLDGSATITFNKQFNRHVMLRSAAFNAGPYQPCPTTVCQAIRNADGEFVFTVGGFSTYLVVEEQPAQMTVSPTEISFTDVNRSQTLNATITITNTGTTDPLTGLSAALSGVASKYQAQLIGTLPGTLAAGDSAAIRLQLIVPADENSGRHRIGQIVVRSNEDTETVNIFLNPTSFLRIDDVTINDETNGDLTLEETNHIEVQVQNDYPQDMKDVRVTVTIKDISDDDLEEESEEQDIDAGRDDTFEVEFDLRQEDIDKDEYTIEIAVEGEAEDGTEHRTVETRTVGLDLENHKVVIEKATLAPEMVECSRESQLRVTVKNIGKNDEDEVSVTVRNEALHIDISKDNIKLDKLTDDDNEEQATWLLDLAEAAAGTYPLTIDVLRDGRLEESTTVTLEVKECLSASTTGRSQSTTTVADQLQQELEEKLRMQQRPQPAAPVTGKTTFRDSTAYLALLGVLVFLCFLAITLALVLGMTQKPQKKKEE